MRFCRFSSAILFFVILGILESASAQQEQAAKDRHLLYVATPGVRNYLEYGGHGLLVFDIDNGHKFVKRIPTGGFDANGKPLNVKGVCAHAESGRIYISTIQHLLCIDLVNEKLALGTQVRWRLRPHVDHARWQNDLHTVVRRSALERDQRRRR